MQIEVKKTISLGLVFYFFIWLPSDAHAEVFKIPLYKLAPVKSVDLRCISAEYGIKIPLPERWKIEKAILTFNYVNSTGLLPDKSRIVIKISDYPIAQVNMSPITPEGSVRLSLPVLLLKPGYNDLSFNVSQHYTMDCEQPCAPDLWTTLKLDQAMLEIEYSLKPVPLKLSSIPEFLFDPRISPHGEVNIILENTSPEMVTLASITASGIARRFDYRKVLFTVTEHIKPGYDNVLVGNKDFIKRFFEIRGLDAPKIEGPLLKLMHLPKDVSEDSTAVSDPNHALLVVSGINSDHTKLAAETLAIMSSPFPDTNEMVAMEFTLPDIPMYGGRLIISHDKKYTFKNLSLPSHTFKGINPSARDIVFRLPADFLIKPNLFADLSLSFSYGAAFRSDSALNISLNGKHLRGIHLDNPNGAIIEGYKISVPTYLFKPGTNVLKFEPVLTPLIYGKCENIQTENLFLTLFEISTFYLPPMPHFVDLPKLELFMLNGFPITRWPDGHESMIYLANPDSNIINAVLNIIGIVTQKNGYPLFEVQFTYDNPKNFNGELLIIGDISSIPENLKQITPLNLTKQTTVPYPVVRSWADEFSIAYSKQISSIGPGRGAVMEFQSPYTGGRSAVLFTATSTKGILSLSEVLMEPSVQAKIEGDLSLIDLETETEDYKVLTFNIGKKYFSGKSGKISKLDLYLYTYPWLYYASVAVVIIFLSLAFFYLLVRYRKKRLKIGEKKPEA